MLANLLKDGSVWEGKGAYTMTSRNTQTQYRSIISQLEGLKS